MIEMVTKEMETQEDIFHTLEIGLQNQQYGRLLIVQRETDFL